MSARYCIRCDELADPSEFMVGLIDTREDDGSEPHFWIHFNCIGLHRMAMIVEQTAAVAAGAREELQNASAQQVPDLKQVSALSKLARAADDVSRQRVLDPREVRDLLQGKDDDPEAKR